MAFTEKGSFLVPKILAVMMSSSVSEMSIQEDKIRFQIFKSSDVQCQI